MTMLSDVRSQIEANNEKFAEIFARGDATGIAGMYTEDAVILPPDAEIIRGRENIMGMWQMVMSSGIKGASLHTLEVETWGNVAKEIGTVTMTVQPPGSSETVTAKAKYVVIWKQEGDTWKMQTDIWNNSPS
ncbi:MAG TPA: DUF4440 domain-containing protein [Chloroflexia bacterium]|nr:DUF4440 domain-containing protein [Chloroflexia bacterium]